MTVMWSVLSFCVWLMQYMNRSLEGTIFINNYFEGLAACSSSIFGAIVYNKYGLKTFIIGYTFAVAGSFSVYLIESKLVTLPQIYLQLFSGSHDLQMIHAIGTIVPRCAFVAKFGIHLATVALYQASFSEETVFPFAKRASAIGFC